MNTETSYKILADSEVYPVGEGYERTLVMANWHPDNPSRLMRVEIRVDRVPGSSFAHASVWTENGWVKVLDYNSVRFWHSMPGYTRWQNDNTDTKTRWLAHDLAYELHRITEYSDDI